MIDKIKNDEQIRVSDPYRVRRPFELKDIKTIGNVEVEKAEHLVFTKGFEGVINPETTVRFIDFINGWRYYFHHSDTSNHLYQNYYYCEILKAFWDEKNDLYFNPLVRINAYLDATTGTDTKGNPISLASITGVDYDWNAFDQEYKVMDALLHHITPVDRPILERFTKYLEDKKDPNYEALIKKYRTALEKPDGDLAKEFREAFENKGEEPGSQPE